MGRGRSPIPASSAVPLACLLLGLLSGPAAAQPPKTVHNLAPYVPSPQQVVERMLDAAGVRPGETVYDLGCGDGRVLITAVEKYRAKAVGVELSPLLARQAAEQIRQRKLEADAKVIEGNMLDVDLSGADVVVLYLLTESNNILKPRLEKFLKPGARVVSHDFEIRGWKPARVESVDAHRRKHKIYVYEVGKK